MLHQFETSEKLIKFDEVPFPSKGHYPLQSKMFKNVQLQI